MTTVGDHLDRAPHRLIWIVLAVLLLAGNVRAADDVREMELQVGETRVLAPGDVKRIAVGNGQIVSASAAEAREVIVFAKQAGTSSLHIWTARARPLAYRIRVVPADFKRIRDDIDTLLARIPGAQAMTVGDKIVIEGGDISDRDRDRIASLAATYPGLIDFTHPMGWERMIMLDVQVVELPRSRVRELGVRWDGATTGGFNTGVVWDSAAINRLGRRPGEAALVPAVNSGGRIDEMEGGDDPNGISSGILQRVAPALGFFGVNAALSARIDAMAQSGEAVVLAQPQLMARSGATAEFLAGGEVPYATTDANGKTTTIFKPYGVALKITPQADGNGAVRSRIEVEASSVDATTPSPSGPALKTRRAATEFNVRSGQTLVLAGFLARERNDMRNGLPGLSRIPVLGYLFGSQRNEVKETELAIFVTPYVIGQDNRALADRVSRSNAILNSSFDDAPRLNTPLGVEQSGEREDWHASAGAGSQWRADATAFVETTSRMAPIGTVRPMGSAGQGMNQYAFDPEP
ncbi:type II and III secretion system protein family protein [Schauerella aestuarii]|uniref:type II and III secretion system protein family protein n=1 Tax=Schauerella aestuarii TaxID=2511204 RepID=UPI001371E17A|nr:pilus assembly protein N-terminal domain-containing protein [Achromobacter aestuarii]MYZ46090.1 secretion protein [Achromobacter aestuarii]